MGSGQPVLSGVPYSFLLCGNVRYLKGSGQPVLSGYLCNFVIDDIGFVKCILTSNKVDYCHSIYYV